MSLCVAQVRDGAQFFTRGVRLLGSDISSAGRLFYRAGAGASLKPREVCADSPFVSTDHVVALASGRTCVRLLAHIDEGL